MVLRTKEFDLLWEMIAHKGLTLCRERLLEIAKIGEWIFSVVAKQRVGGVALLLRH